MGVYRATHDLNSERSVAGTVVEAVAAASGADPTEMERLHDVVDPDALDRLFESTGRSERTGRRACVEFAFEDHQVTVTSDGTVGVRDPADGARDDGALDDVTFDDVTDAATFEAALERLVRSAEANGVDVNGGWACRDDGVGPDWGIEVYEVSTSPHLG